ncbi:MAG: 2-amino-4-hydroxy-6-hydroxymethyldihydropteridine diphosphokinase [Bacteroidota bacterium]
MKAEDTHPAPRSNPVAAYVGLGANLGDRMGALQAAVVALAKLGVVVAVSPVYCSEAHTLDPEASAPEFLNAVAHLQTKRSAEEVLAGLHRIEQQHGRQRPVRWAPRTLDLDLLLYGDLAIATDALVVPHPRFHLRRFVLQPLADLAPALWVSAPHHATVSELLARCPDTHALRRHAQPLVCPDATPKPA